MFFCQISSKKYVLAISFVLSTWAHKDFPKSRNLILLNKFTNFFCMST